jgi:hypothetical protein
MSDASNEKLNSEEELYLQKKEIIHTFTNSIFTDSSELKKTIDNSIEKLKDENVFILEFIIFFQEKSTHQKVLYNTLKLKKNNDELKHILKEIINNLLEEFLLKSLKYHNIKDYNMDLLKENFIYTLCFLKPDDQYIKTSVNVTLPAYRFVCNTIDIDKYLVLYEEDNILSEKELIAYIKKNLEIAVDYYINIYYCRNCKHIVIKKKSMELFD